MNFAINQPIGQMPSVTNKQPAHQQQQQREKRTVCDTNKFKHTFKLYWIIFFPLYHNSKYKCTQSVRLHLSICWCCGKCAYLNFSLICRIFCFLASCNSIKLFVFMVVFFVSVYVTGKHNFHAESKKFPVFSLARLMMWSASSWMHISNMNSAYIFSVPRGFIYFSKLYFAVFH